MNALTQALGGDFDEPDNPQNPSLTTRRGVALAVVFGLLSFIGFEAAAVTGFMVATSRVRTQPGIRRTAHVRFGHPFAVVAAAFDDSRRDPRAAPISTRWNGVPVFSAWVSEPCDAEPIPGS